MLEFWLKLLTMRSGWHFDPDICYILDEVLSAAFCNKGGCSIAEEVLLKLYKVNQCLLWLRKLKMLFGVTRFARI